MQKAEINERARIEAQKLYAEELKKNHGKPSSYFMAPKLSQSRKRRDSLAVTLETQEKSSRSVERAGGRQIGRTWGSAIVTKQQVERAQASKVMKKVDLNGVILDENVGPYKYGPLAP